MSTVIVPAKTRVFGADTEDHYRYWVQLASEEKPKWVRFDRFDVKNVD